MSECYVYVAAVSVDGQAMSPVKVGISSNPWSRVCEMQTGCPDRLCVAHAFQMTTRECALAIERYFHDCLSDTRIHGEWFNLEPYEAIDFLSLVIDRPLEKRMGDVPLFLHAVRERVGINQAARILAGEA